MNYLVELPVATANQTPYVVKVAIEGDEEGLVEVARPGQVVARATRSLGEMLGGIRLVAQNFVDGFADMPDAPDEIGVEFGLSLSGEADVVISKTAAAANFKVSLTWRSAPASAVQPAVPAAAPAPDPQVAP